MANMPRDGYAYPDGDQGAHAHAHGDHNHDYQGDAHARAGYQYQQAPADVQYHAAQENVVINPKVVDVHSANPFGSHSEAGMFNSLFLDVESEKKLLDFSCYSIIVFGMVIYVLLHFLPSAYGRYASRAFGILIPAKIAWFLQDLPAVVIPIFVYLRMEHTQLHLANYILLAVFIMSYAQRAFVYSALIRGGKPVPSVPFFGAMAYNSINSYMIARYLTRFSYYDPLWIVTPNFLGGMAMFVIGFLINLQSDSILRGLRSPLSRMGFEPEPAAARGPKTVKKLFDQDLGLDQAGPGGPMPSAHFSASRTSGQSEATGYKIPRGGMFEFVSCANFFGEIVAWIGFAMASWSLPALAHAIFTCANLIPRALQHHQDYLTKFREDYPKSRSAIIPFLL